MISRRRLLELVPVVLLTFAAISPIIQIVGAPIFFDHQITLQSKADPALRMFLGKLTSQSEVRVLLVFSEIPSAQEVQRLRELGDVESFTGHVATMHLPINRLPEVAVLNSVDHISYPRTLTPMLDPGIPDILADQVWKVVKDANGRPVTGAGVVIGVVDTGIDLTHRDFFFQNGTSKIPFLWDQSTKGSVPQGFDYGNECLKAQIQFGTCGEIDGSSDGGDYLGTGTGHGTAVAAVAASTGQGTDQFENCLLYDGTIWYDDKELCQYADAKSLPFLATSLDYRYFGGYEKFNQVYISLEAGGHYNDVSWEYSQGNGRWGELKFNPNSVYNPSLQFNFTLDGDGTSGFSKNGTVFFRPPVDWAPDSVNHLSDYWIRVKATQVLKPAIVKGIRASPPYIGVAPGALIIPVKLRDGNDDSVLDGIQYVVTKARELGLPVVINHSFGDILGPHDGTGTLDLGLTDLASNGVPIVLPAGNSRMGNTHISGKLATGQTVTVPWLNINAQEEGIDLWFSRNDSLGISVITPAGSAVLGPTADSGFDTPDGNVTILSNKYESSQEWFIDITPRTGVVAGMNLWTFALTANRVQDGSWDAWTKPGTFAPNTNPATAGLYRIDPSDTIDSTATAVGTITVGAYITQYYWRSGCGACIQYTGANGLRGVARKVYPPGVGVGELIPSSAMGPTRDGRTKPDLTAPGSAIVVARATNGAVDTGADPDNHHRVVSGTSFSAPHVAGVIALMLQMNPYLSPDQIKTILTETARQDQFTGVISKSTGSNLWGWGKVNALNSTLQSISFYSVRVDVESVGSPLTGILTLDGRTVKELKLNDSRFVILEFRGRANHTIALSQIIQVDSGTRYILAEEPWTFSTGGAITFHYRLQYHLNVKSEFGNATGTGWYDANSTVTASVTPSGVEGYEFVNWIGAVSSDSPTVQVRMDSGEEIVAVWRPTNTFMNTGTIMGIVLAAAISLAVILIVRYKMPNRNQS